MSNAVSTIDRTTRPGSLRVSDAEREQVAGRIRDAATVGMLTLAEANQCQAAAYAAQIRAGTVMTAKAQLSGRPRKFVRATHVAVAAGWLGLVVAMLTLGTSAATASYPMFALACYTMMERIGGAVIPFFAVVTLLTGIVLSVATPWQLLQYWWIVVKLVLARAVIVTFLWAATTISVDKPWVKIKRRQHSAVHQREPAGVIGQY
jgi:hypothetical protein